MALIKPPYLVLTTRHVAGGSVVLQVYILRGNNGVTFIVHGSGDFGSTKDQEKSE
jgi:hypothetical protein